MAALPIYLDIFSSLGKQAADLTAQREDGRPLRPSPGASISSHISRQLGWLHNIHKQFSFLFFAMTDGSFRHLRSTKGRRDITSLCGSVINLQHQSVYPKKPYDTQPYISKLRVSVTHFWASCHLTGNKGPDSKLICLALYHKTFFKKL